MPPTAEGRSGGRKEEGGRGGKREEEEVGARREDEERGGRRDWVEYCENVWSFSGGKMGRWSILLKENGRRIW